MATAAKKSAGTIKIRQIASGANAMLKQQKTLTGLGLNKIGRVRELQDTPAVRGMIEKVKHLVKIEN